MHSAHRRYHALNLRPRSSSHDDDHSPLHHVGDEGSWTVLPVPALAPRSPPGSDRSSSSPSSSTSSTTTTTSVTSSSVCRSGDSSSRCAKPTSSSSTTLPIALGVIIPVVFAIVLFVWLHRRHVKKLRKEDANDKHRSLDFGMDAATGSSTARACTTAAHQEMTRAHPATAQPRGLSMDMGNPYLLPPGLHGSRESLHSLSRTIYPADDRYRPATTLASSDAGSVYAEPNLRTRDWDDVSSYTAPSGGPRDGMNQGLLEHAARPSRSSPPVPRSVPDPMPERTVSGRRPSPPSNLTPPRMDSLPAPLAVHLTGAPSPPPGPTMDASLDRDGSDLHRRHHYLGPLITADGTPAVTPPPPPRTISSPESLPPPPSSSSSSSVVWPMPATDRVAGTRAVEPPPWSLTTPASSPSVGELMSERSNMPDGADQPWPPRSMGSRPLPPEDPSDRPEQRANRIRSFYKEYFDESRPTPAAYLDDQSPGYLGAPTDPDAATGEFWSVRAPYSQSVGRRAMTPPPRAPPRFQAGPSSHPSSGRVGSPPPPGLRSHSSASGGFGHGPSPRGRAPQRRVAPPTPAPGPLRDLPTPHVMKEDAFALPIDFAPPTTYRDRQAGHPASPMGGLRPYSPTLPVHRPLVSSFDDLSVMPSPSVSYFLFSLSLSLSLPFFPMYCPW